MSGKKSPKSVLATYQKRQRMMPIFTWGLALLLVLIGVILLVVWFTGPNRPKLAFLASATPTATFTATFSPTVPSSTPTITPTITETPTETITSTPSGPFEYTVEQDDTCYDLAAKFNVDLLVLLTINNFASNSCPIKPGDTILIPIPGQALPTDTPLPPDTPRGTRIEYTVQTGDTLDLIASKFNTTVDDILLQNNITDKDVINVGDTLIVRVNLVTPTPTRKPSLTPTPGGATPTPSETPTA
jgi:LysM repeat protein